MARYTTDVTFQQSHRPSGNVDGGKMYYRGKQELYGYKTEVSVLPNGLALGYSDHYPGSYWDIDIFYKKLRFHKVDVKKAADEREITDVGILVEKYPGFWVVLMDKGYQGAAEYVHALPPLKKLRNGHLTQIDETFNKKVSGDRIIVENYFGRQCTLWKVTANKFRWAEKTYEAVFRFTLAMTNAHILKHPLRAEDNENFHRMRNRRLEISAQVMGKRKRTQERYREKRRMRMATQFRAADPELGAGAMSDFDDVGDA